MTESTESTASAEQQANGEQAQDAGTENTNAPFAVFPTADSFNQRMDRAAKKRINDIAKEAGFDSWEAMQAKATETLKATAAEPIDSTNESEVKPDNAKPEAPSEAALVRMAVQVAADKGLPATLALRIQGDTLEAMSADADQLIAAMGNASAPGIPGVRSGAQPVTITRTQMQNPDFVRKHADEIRRAAAEGRIVES